jgi:hypothetical protein
MQKYAKICKNMQKCTNEPHLAAGICKKLQGTMQGAAEGCRGHVGCRGYGIAETMGPREHRGSHKRPQQVRLSCKKPKWAIRGCGGCKGLQGADGVMRACKGLWVAPMVFGWQQRLQELHGLQEAGLGHEGLHKALVSRWKPL